MDLQIGEYNKSAYRRAQNMLKTNNVAAIVQPMLSNISDIAVSFLGDTQGRTICVEDDSSRMYGGIKAKVNALIKQGKISKSEAQRFSKIEYTTFPQLIRKIKEGRELSDYENILLMDLQYCDESMWKDGIEVLLGENKDARTLELVEFSTMSRDTNNATFRRLRGHVASFISEEEATRLGVCGLICTNETNVIESELKQKLRKVNKLEDKELQKQLREKAREIEELNKRILSMYQNLTDDIDIEDVWSSFVNGDKDDSDRLTEEEFQQRVDQDLEIFELRNRVRKLLEEIGEAVGEEHEKSELEALRDEYHELEEKEKGAKDLLDQVEAANEEKDRSDESGR